MAEERERDDADLILPPIPSGDDYDADPECMPVMHLAYLTYTSNVTSANHFILVDNSS
eukprot:gene22066-29131_t